MIKLGDKVKDSITGFTGVVVGRFEFLYGCVRLSVQPAELKDGKPIECQCFDEPQLMVLGGESHYATAPKTAAPGGPRDDPKRPDVPSRR